MFGDIKRFGAGQVRRTLTGKFFILIKFWFTSQVLLLPGLGEAQLLQSTRFEVLLDNNDNYFEVASAELNGALLYRDASTNRIEQFELIHLDTAFVQKWKGTLLLDKKFTLIKQTSRGSEQFLLFYNREFSDINFHFYKVNLVNGSITKYIIDNYIPFLPTHFEVTENGALTGGYFLGRIPVVLFFDFKTYKSKILPGLFNEAGELLQININPDQSFNVLIGAKNHLKQKTIWIKDYDPNGGLNQNMALKPEGNDSMLFGRAIKTENKDLLIAGVYGNRNSDYSKGLFIARVNNEGDQILTYYNFADLENFFNYMKANQQKRVKNRIERKRIKGKRLKFQYRILVHELVRYDNQFLLLGEAFYPKYKQDNSNLYGLALSNFHPLIFDGYQYTHAVIIGFNNNGKLLWDNSFEINDVRTFSLDQYVRMNVQQNQIALLYLFKNKIRSKLIQDNKVIEGKIYNQLKMRFEDLDSEENSEINKLEYWYDDNFIAYGVQRKGSQSFANSKQRVFFINKVSYR